MSEHSTDSELSEIERLTAEVKHWKDHAEEAGAGFSQVCKASVRAAARHRELVRQIQGLVESPETDLFRDEACRHVAAQPCADNRYVRLLDAVREVVRDA